MASKTKRDQLSEQVADRLRTIIEEYRSLLGLERYEIRLEVKQSQPKLRAAQEAEPEYESSLVVVDMHEMETGDNLEEMLGHELSHVVHWELHDVAEELCVLAARGDKFLLEKLREEVRKAAELATTRWGKIAHKYLLEVRNARRV